MDLRSDLLAPGSWKSDLRSQSKIIPTSLQKKTNRLFFTIHHSSSILQNIVDKILVDGLHAFDQIYSIVYQFLLESNDFVTSKQTSFFLFSQYQVGVKFVCLKIFRYWQTLETIY